MAKQNKQRNDRYFQLHHYMLKTEAWQSLSAPARAVYVQIGFRYNGANNGKIAYSVRDAASECNIAINTASRVFRELVELGFIEETRHRALSRKTRVASEWRLTAFKCDLTGALKTCLFMQRGSQARDSRQSRSRSSRLSQTTISRGEEPVSNEVRECLKTDNSLYQTTISDSTECLKRGSVEADFEGPPVSNESTHIVYQVGADTETAAAGPQKARAAAVEGWKSLSDSLSAALPALAAPIAAGPKLKAAT